MSTAEPNSKSATYDAGIYAVVSRKTGAMYVGSSCRLMQRLDQHRTTIRSQTFGRATAAYREAFTGHAEADIEFRILERVEVRAGGEYAYVRTDEDSEPGRQKLFEREGHWIRTLKPSVNSPRFHRPRLGHEIPVVDLSAKQSA
jgi:hypothetical protein